MEPGKFNEAHFDKKGHLDMSTMVQTGTIELRPIANAQSKTPRAQFATFTTQDGKTIGIVDRLNKEEEPVYRKFVITGHRFYDLKKKRDAEEWHVVQYAPCVKGSPIEGAAGIKPMWEVYNPEAKAAKIISKSYLMAEAFKVILALKGNALLDWALCFGIDPKSNSNDVMLQQLLEKAMKVPHEIIKFTKDAERMVLVVILKRAMTVGVITNNPTRGYMYDETLQLGTTEENVIDYLRKDMRLAAVIDDKAKNLDTFYQKNKREDVSEEKVGKATATPKQAKGGSKVTKAEKVVEPEPESESDETPNFE